MVVRAQGNSAEGDVDIRSIYRMGRSVPALGPDLRLLRFVSLKASTTQVIIFANKIGTQ